MGAHINIRANRVQEPDSGVGAVDKIPHAKEALSRTAAYWYKTELATATDHPGFLNPHTAVNPAVRDVYMQYAHMSYA